MNDIQRLAICEVCKNKEFSPKLGVICALTSERPTFEGNCSEFESDAKMVARKQREEESRKNLSEGGGGDLVQVDEKNSSPWKIVLTVVIVLFFVLRLLMRCDRMLN